MLVGAANFFGEEVLFAVLREDLAVQLDALGDLDPLTLIVFLLLLLLVAASFVLDVRLVSCNLQLPAILRHHHAIFCDSKSLQK